MKAHRQVWLLVVGAVAPIVVFASLAALLLVQHERQTLERDAIGRARAAMTAVDAHLRGSIASLETLAASKNLEAGDLAAFHEESQRVLRTQPGWMNIGLASAAKVQVSDAVYVFGKPAPFSANEDSFDAVLRGAKAAIGNVMAGSAVRSPSARVRVPVIVGGEVRYVMSAPLNPKHFADLLQGQRLPDDWVIGVVDREKRVVARIPAVAPGTPASDNLREAIEREPEGWFYGRTMEGRATYTSYVTSPLSGWVLGIAMPAVTVESEVRRIFAILGAGALCACAVAALLAWLIAGRISR
jgi:hypothetical protein